MWARMEENVWGQMKGAKNKIVKEVILEQFLRVQGPFCLAFYFTLLDWYPAFFEEFKACIVDNISSPRFSLKNNSPSGSWTEQ